MGLKPVPMTHFPAEWILEMSGTRNAHRVPILEGTVTGRYSGKVPYEQRIDTGNAGLLWWLNIADMVAIAGAVTTMVLILWRLL